MACQLRRRWIGISTQRCQVGMPSRRRHAGIPTWRVKVCIPRTDCVLEFQHAWMHHHTKRQERAFSRSSGQLAAVNVWLINGNGVTELHEAMCTKYKFTGVKQAVYKLEINHLWSGMSGQGHDQVKYMNKAVAAWQQGPNSRSPKTSHQALAYGTAS